MTPSWPPSGASALTPDRASGGPPRSRATDGRWPRRRAASVQRRRRGMSSAVCRRARRRRHREPPAAAAAGLGSDRGTAAEEGGARSTVARTRQACRRCGALAYPARSRAARTRPPARSCRHRDRPRRQRRPACASRPHSASNSSSSGRRPMSSRSRRHHSSVAHLGGPAVPRWARTGLVCVTSALQSIRKARGSERDPRVGWVLPGPTLHVLGDAELGGGDRSDSAIADRHPGDVPRLH